MTRLIGQECKHGNMFSLLVLIVRATCGETHAKHNILIEVVSKKPASYRCGFFLAVTLLSIPSFSVFSEKGLPADYKTKLHSDCATDSNSYTNMANRVIMPPFRLGIDIQSNVFQIVHQHSWCVPFRTFHSLTLKQEIKFSRVTT